MICDYHRNAVMARSLLIEHCRAVVAAVLTDPAEAEKLPALEAQIEALDRIIEREDRLAKDEVAAQRKAEAASLPAKPQEIRRNTYMPRRPAFLDPSPWG